MIRWALLFAALALVLAGCGGTYTGWGTPNISECRALCAPIGAKALVTQNDNGNWKCGCMENFCGN